MFSAEVRASKGGTDQIRALTKHIPTFEDLSLSIVGAS